MAAHSVALLIGSNRHFSSHHLFATMLLILHSSIHIIVTYVHIVDTVHTKEEMLFWPVALSTTCTECVILFSLLSSPPKYLIQMVSRFVTGQVFPEIQLFLNQNVT